MSTRSWGYVRENLTSNSLPASRMPYLTFFVISFTSLTYSRQGIESAQSFKLPDFCQLVNFPEYLARARGGGGDAKSSSAAAAASDGKRHCVMCGQPRVCSANSLLAGRSRTVTETDDTDSDLHIIPRQNKGVCTACDVTVWAVRDRDNVEIKWCKGCKNFRPWAAFGEKGMATKCVRCRTRQKEKYAAAKVGAMKRGGK